MSKAGVRVKARLRAKKKQAFSRVATLFALGTSIVVAAVLLTLLFGRALGYALGSASTAISIYILYRWRKEEKCLLLGEVLLALSTTFIIAAFASQYVEWGRVTETATPETSALPTETSTFPTPRPGVVRGHIGIPIDVDIWRITLEEVKEVKHISENNRYYSSREGMKIVLAKIRIENAGRSKTMPGVRSHIWNPTLFTDANKSYTRIYPSNLAYVLEPPAEVEQYVDLDLTTVPGIEPGSHIEGHVMFQVPDGEKPKELQLYVGLPEPTRVFIAIEREG